MTDEEVRASYKPSIAILEMIPLDSFVNIMAAVNSADDSLYIIPPEAFDEIGAVVLLARLK
jgi:hypothetical protein